MTEQRSTEQVAANIAKRLDHVRAFIAEAERRGEDSWGGTSVEYWQGTRDALSAALSALEGVGSLAAEPEGSGVVSRTATVDDVTYERTSESTYAVVLDGTRVGSVRRVTVAAPPRPGQRLRSGAMRDEWRDERDAYRVGYATRKAATRALLADGGFTVEREVGR